MESLYTIRDSVCAALDEIANVVREKGCVPEHLIPDVDALTHTLKSIETTLAMRDSGYYGRRSYDGGSSMDGGYSERRGRSMQTGRFVSRDSGRSGYSRDSGHDFAHEVEDIMRNSSDNATKQRLQDLYQRMTQQ